MDITAKSLDLFLKYAKDFVECDGLVWLNGSKEERGNLTQLKKAKLVETEFYDKGQTYLIFTDEGKKLAAKYGIEI